MPKYVKERAVNEFHYADIGNSGIERHFQSNGECLVVTNKSTQKKHSRYFYEGYFEGYDRKLVFRLEQAREGKVWNPDKPDEYGFVVGAYNVDKYIYNIWKNMERRCYYPNSQSFSLYGAKGTIVSDEFKSYTYFESWYKNNWDGISKLELDKDVKSNGQCKIYSPSTCILIPSAINTFISTLGEKRGIEERHNTLNTTYCLHYRRKYKKINKSFKTLNEAILFKKELDKQYLEYLLSVYSLREDIQTALRNYVEIFVC